MGRKWRRKATKESLEIGALDSVHSLLVSDDTIYVVTCAFNERERKSLRSLLGRCNEIWCDLLEQSKLIGGIDTCEKLLKGACETFQFPNRQLLPESRVRSGSLSFATARISHCLAILILLELTMFFFFPFLSRWDDKNAHENFLKFGFYFHHGPAGKSKRQPKNNKLHEIKSRVLETNNVSTETEQKVEFRKLGLRPKKARRAVHSTRRVICQKLDTRNTEKFIHFISMFFKHKCYTTRLALILSHEKKAPPLELYTLSPECWDKNT